MQIIKQAGSIACTAMAVFLFSYSVSLSLASSKDCSQTPQEFFSKTGNLPVNPDGQFPFEEKDEEAGDEFQDSFSSFCVPAEIVSLILIEGQFFSICEWFGPENTLSHVPIYLAQRALII